jgi:hypothetical protein
MLLGAFATTYGQVATVSRHVLDETLQCVPETPTQQKGSGEPLCVCSEPSKCTTPPALLTRHLTRGASRTLHNYAWEIIGTLRLRGSPELQKQLGDTNRNYYRLIWEGPGPDGKPVGYTLLVHGTSIPESGLRLPGITSDRDPRLIDILVSDTTAPVLETVFVSTREADPLDAQIPAFIEKTGVIGFVAGTQGKFGAPPPAEVADVPLLPPPPEPVKVTFKLYAPDVPFPRATIAVKDVIVTPAAVDDFLDEAGKLRTRLKTHEARSSACAMALVDDHYKAVDDTLKSAAACKPDSRQGAECVKALVSALEKSFADRMATKLCVDEKAAPAPDDPVLLVDTRFHADVSGLKETRRTAESKLLNVPHTRYTFGLVSSVIVGTPHAFGGAVRAKVNDDGLYVEDPMAAILNMAVVNIQPWGYDNATPKPEGRERFRLFLGTSFTPDFGIGGGVGFGIIRGLAVNAGWTNLFVNTPKGGIDKLGKSPEDKRDPFEIGYIGVWFAGVSYNFK